MAGEADKAKGRVKKAVGELTNDEDLRREGNIDEACGKVKEVTGKVADSTVSQDMEPLFTRYPGNPILTAKDIPYPANTVFNAGAVKVGDETVLLMRVEDRRGLSHLTVARSTDGLTRWRVDPHPTFPADPVGHPEEIWGIEDPRICCMDGETRCIIAYTAYSEGGRSCLSPPPRTSSISSVSVRSCRQTTRTRRSSRCALGAGTPCCIAQDLLNWASVATFGFPSPLTSNTGEIIR